MNEEMHDMPNVAAESTQEQAKVSQEETPAAKNWRLMREENERIKQEAAELRKQLESRRGDDELVEQRHLRELAHKMETQMLESRVKLKFPDFDEIVNTENLKKLAAEDPELASTIDSTPDMYNKAVAAYKMIKSKQAPVYQPSEEDELYEENNYKPRPVNSLNMTGDRPINTASAFQRGLTKEMKDKLWLEMQEAIKNRY